MSEVTSAARVSRGFRTAAETIVCGDGTELAAIVVQPDGPGRFPLLVMPSSWAVNDVEYVAAAVRLARLDYVVVSYTSRGFWNSGGEIDIAGSATVGDVSTVIAWAIDRYPVSDMIGAVGISYGAGTSLLAAAVDDRIKAVAAMSTWASLAAALVPNGALSTQAAHLLVWAGDVTGRPGPDMLAMREYLTAGQIGPILDMLPERSPADSVAAINANKPAVLLANAWEDGFFPPGQVVDFFNELTCPKRLVLAAGDHATAELPGLLGLANYPWDAVRQWMDLHLRGVGAAPPVVSLKSADGGGWHSYPDWRTATASTTRCYLGEPRAEDLVLPRTGSLAPAPAAAGWDYAFEAGLSTIAESGDALVTGLFEAYFHLPPVAVMPFVRRAASGVWWTEPLSGSALLTGSAEVHLTISITSADTATLFVYLYDVNEVEVGRLITHEPYTLNAAAPTQAQSIKVQLQPIAWRVQGGHRIALVIDTMDKRYSSTSVIGSTITLHSAAANPSYVDLPIALP